jgi:gluconokinase
VSVSDPRVVVVMGVSGSGKSTVARALADRLGCALLEGDDLHPLANVAAMAAGRPLTDAERRPWLEAIGHWVDRRAAEGVGAVVTCSALRRSYRDQLRDGRPTLTFCHLTVDPAVLERRMALRSGHFMPASLLPSQLTTLEPLAPDEPGISVASDGPVESVVDEVVRRLDLRTAPPGSSAETDPLH